MAGIPTDEEVARRVQGGDPASFGVLVERYEPKMLRYARKFLLDAADSEDQVQEVFLKAYANIRGFDASMRFSPWIYRIAHNQFVNELKRRGREAVSFVDLDEVFPHLAAEDTADAAAEREETKRILEQCLESVGPKYREPLVLYYYEELGYKEIADILQVPVSTVGVRLSRGRERLREIFEQHTKRNGRQQ